MFLLGLACGVVTEAVDGGEFGRGGDGEGAGNCGDGVVDEEGEERDLRGRDGVRGGGAEQGFEGVERGDGARGDDAVECVTCSVIARCRKR